MGGEVKQVAVDLPQVLHLVLQLSHTDPQLVLAAQHALGRGGGSAGRLPRAAQARPRGPAPCATPPTFSMVLHSTACSRSARSR